MATTNKKTLPNAFTKEEVKAANEIIEDIETSLDSAFNLIKQATNNPYLMRTGLSINANIISTPLPNGKTRVKFNMVAIVPKNNN